MVDYNTNPNVGNSNWQGPSGGMYGGGGGLLAGYRSILDANRAGANPQRAPYAEYPAGYLGNVNSRREDKLLNKVKQKLSDKSYQRGVHRGERLDPSDYFWDEDIIDPMAGVRAEAKGQRWTAKGDTPQNIINHNHGNTGLLLTPEELARVANGLGISTPDAPDPIRASKMKSLLPNWK